MVPLYKATPPHSVTGTPFDLFLMEKQAADGVAGAAADADKCAEVATLFAKEMAGQEPTGDPPGGVVGGGAGGPYR